MIRCPLCAGLTHAPLCEDYLRCKLCGLGFRPRAAAPLTLADYQTGDGAYLFPNWNNLFFRLAGRPFPPAGQDPLFSPAAVEIFAIKEGYYVRNWRSSLLRKGPFLPWSRGVCIRVGLERMPAAAPGLLRDRLTLGVIAASNAADDVVALCNDLVPDVAQCVVVLDTAVATEAEALQERLEAVSGAGRVRVFAQLLEGDFARQRNRVQQEARTGWVLHLDCDERLSRGARSRLPALLDEAGRRGWAVLAFARANLVDGEASAFFPDVQYRLLWQSIRFTGTVHEHPETTGRHSTFPSLGPGILHYRQAATFAKRAEFYETIREGPGSRTITSCFAPGWKRIWRGN